MVESKEAQMSMVKGTHCSAEKCVWEETKHCICEHLRDSHSIRLCSASRNAILMLNSFEIHQRAILWIGLEKGCRIICTIKFSCSLSWTNYCSEWQLARLSKMLACNWRDKNSMLPWKGHKAYSSRNLHELSWDFNLEESLQDRLVMGDCLAEWESFLTSVSTLNFPVPQENPISHPPISSAQFGSLLPPPALPPPRTILLQSTYSSAHPPWCSR